MGFRIRVFRIKFLLFCVILTTFCSLLIKFHQNSKTTKDYNLNQAKLIYSINFTSLNLDNIDKDLNELRNYQYKIKNSLDTNVNRDLKTVSLNSRKLKEPSEKYIILEYTNVFFGPKFCDRTNRQIFDSEIETCEFKNCEYSCNKEADLSTADALLFHQRDLEAEFFKLENFAKWVENTKQLPYKTTKQKLENNPDQIWILWNDEATKVDENFNSISELFNWTMSYKTDAEIFEGSYGIFLPNLKLSQSDINNHKKEIYKNFIERQNAILWFVTNCNSKQRLKVALEISQYYPLHIYGGCDLSKQLTDKEIREKYLHLKLFSNQNSPNCERNSDCENKKFESYRYYLAFENKNCTDYITEKIWKSLNKHMIPIVLQPSRNSYQRYSIPPKSFIHLEDFSFDVNSFTKYLKEIDRDFKKYYDHLKWTSIYLKTYNDGKETEPHRMCQLCKKLNTYKHSVNYNKISDFFNHQCRD